MRNLLLAVVSVFSLNALGCSLCGMGANDAASAEMRSAERNDQPAPQPQPTAQPMPAGYGAMMARAYSQMIFGMGFGGGAFAAGVNYKPGEYTRWKMSANDSTFERAYLFNDASGNAWWKLKLVDGRKNQTIIYEALLTSDRTKVLRLRAKLPNDTAPQELPVDDTAQVPQQMNPAGGQDKGIEAITVPAGAFSAHHVVFSNSERGGSADVWTAEKVPGGTVRVQAHGNSGSHGEFEMALAAYGGDAKSELGTTP